MRARITWLVGLTTSAIVAAFVIPLCLLVQVMAHDRAVASARDRAQSVAGVVATVTDPDQRRATVDLFVARGIPVSVVTPDGTVLGTPLPARSNAIIATARETGTALTEDHDYGTEVAVPVTTSEGVNVVHLLVSPEALGQGVLPVWWTIAGVGGVLILSSVVVARQLGKRIAVPVTDVADVAHRLREGDLTARATPSGPTETVELGRALNALAERIVQLVDDERENIADLGHRLRTPITALRLDADLVADREVGTRLRQHVDELHRSVDFVIREARRRTREQLPHGCDLVAVVGDRVEFWRPLAEDQGRRLDTVLPTEPLSVALGQGDLSDLVDILIDNVFAHTPEQTSFAIEVGHTTDLVTLTVIDDGPGAALVEPSRGASGAGSTGLGLDIVRRLARGVGGSLETASGRSGGFIATVRLPRLTEPTAGQ